MGDPSPENTEGGVVGAKPSTDFARGESIEIGWRRFDRRVLRTAVSWSVIPADQ
jgi:hypothetical protein